MIQTTFLILACLLHPINIFTSLVLTHIIYHIKMRAALAIVCLMAIVTLGLSKAMVAGKVILALNCGSKDEVVDSHDKVFKYQGVSLSRFRTKSTSQASLSQSTITPTRKPRLQTSSTLLRRGSSCTRDTPTSRWSTLCLSERAKSLLSSNSQR